VQDVIDELSMTAADTGHLVQDAENFRVTAYFFEEI